MKQYEAVIKVMEENGGFATLSYLYENVLKVPNVTWKTKTPFASIRRIVQDSRFFFRIKPGLWALKSYKNKLPNEILSLIEKEKQTKKEEKLTHSYYQGMIVEIGNIKGFTTYVPPQDQNKKFLGKTLKEIINLKTIYRFTYDDVLEKIKSIDVFWFNERKFPSFIFEIEHTTDFKNALLKFLELQDFNTKMFIVSYKARKKDFLSKIDFTSFRPIRNKVKFLSYEEVSQWHAKSYELILTEKKII
ncbi:hypothetical protein NLC29_01310 [Candidatus Aminicenantes bacterium AH-873-B07]|nr:hypothetical protein [Candidatus Aminicenantes bacterium AH-873-B07]